MRALVIVTLIPHPIIYYYNPIKYITNEPFMFTASISSRPGQCGRADGYILEGKELEFYIKKIKSKKSK